MLRSLWRAETGVFFCVWIYLLLAGHQGAFLRDPGVFWHRVVGERILATGEFLRPGTQTDPFSCTRQGEPWIAQQWLAECFMATLYRIGGLDGLVLAGATILAALHAWVAHRIIRAGFHWLFGVLLAVLFFFASSYHFHPRPHLATIVLIGWTFARLCDVENGRRSFRSLIWLVPMFILWTNLHGGVLGGMATVGCVVAGWVLARGAGLRSPIRGLPGLASAGALVLACGLTALVNPYGMRLLEVWRSLSNSPTLRQFIFEHQPLNPSEPGGRTVLLLGLLYVVALAASWPNWPRITWLIPLIWLYLACRSIRHGPLFAVTACVGLADLLPQTRFADLLKKHAPDLYAEPSAATPSIPNSRFSIDDFQLKALSFLLPASLVFASLLLQGLGLSVPLLGRGWTQLDSNYWPLSPVNELKREPPETPIFNDMLFGGFVIADAPHLRVFIDDRCELYGDAFIREYFEAERDDPARLEEWAKAYGFRHALVRSDSEQNPSPFDRYLHEAPGWEVVERTPGATLYRQVPPTEKGERGPE